MDAHLIMSLTNLKNLNIKCTKYYERTLKVNKFQNEFMKSSFLPKYERNPYNFWFIFWEER